MSLSSLSNENAGEVEFPLDGLTPLIFGMVNSFSICYNEQQYLYACRTKRKGVSAETNIQYSNSRVSREYTIHYGQNLEENTKINPLLQ